MAPVFILCVIMQGSPKNFVPDGAGPLPASGGAGPHRNGVDRIHRMEDGCGRVMS